VNLPEKYTESMKMMLGDEYDSYIESFNDKRLYGLRVNNLKISTEDFLKICPFKLEPVPWILQMPLNSLAVIVPVVTLGGGHDDDDDCAYSESLVWKQKTSQQEELRVPDQE